MKNSASRLYVVFFSLWLLGIPLVVSAQPAPEREAKILKLMEEIFDKVSPGIAEIDPDLERIAVYRLAVDSKMISAPLREHFESRLVEIFRELPRPLVVSLPEMNTLKISSTDTSFSVVNSLPSPDELWRVGRRLRVNAFLEGSLVYMPGKALILDLRLTKTGTNEVLWARSFSAYEADLAMTPKNPFRYNFSAGVEVFPIEFESAADSLLRSDFTNRLTQQSVYLGVYQYVAPRSRLRYEVSFGISFLADGIKMRDTFFNETAFYGASTESGLLSAMPVSYNLRSVLYSTLVDNDNNPAGDWLALYLALTRYFAMKMPDLTGIGIGLRSDLNPHFSFSAGFSLIMGQEFESIPVQKTHAPVTLRVNGLHYQLMFLQYTF